MAGRYGTSVSVAVWAISAAFSAKHVTVILFRKKRGIICLFGLSCLFYAHVLNLQ